MGVAIPPFGDSSDLGINKIPEHSRKGCQAWLCNPAEPRTELHSIRAGSTTGLLRDQLQRCRAHEGDAEETEFIPPRPDNARKSRSGNKCATCCVSLRGEGGYGEPVDEAMAIIKKLLFLPGFRHELRERRDRLYRLAFSWCHNAALADDLTQEALTKALRNSTQLRDDQRLDSWLFRILANCWQDHLRVFPARYQ